MFQSSPAKCFATFAGVGRGCDPPFGISKRSVVELQGKDQEIALDEYSRVLAALKHPSLNRLFYNIKIKTSRTINKLLTYLQMH